MRGDIDGALESFEALIVESPGDVEVRIHTADLYLKSKKKPERAIALFREVQRMPEAPPERYIYAANRIVDIYRDTLKDDGKALVELRKLVERFPASVVASHAREAIALIKANREMS